ncbi:MAG TPA: hypothetical protein VE404_06335 [Verrucomicrobiae bacterium]|nr:hypothetical protein [Verrucomicrobiae bacterium]
MQPTLFLLPGFVLMAAILVFLRLRLRAKIAPLEQALDGGQAETTGVLAPKLSGRFRDREASFRLTPGGKNHPRRFVVRLGCKGGPVFEIRREDLGAKLAKKLHLMTDVEIGDPDLDAKLVFSSKEPDALVRLMSAAEARGAVAALLLELGVDRLTSGWECLVAEHVRYGDADLDPPRVRQVLERMEIVARTLVQV